jgi:hypothetical protein
MISDDENPLMAYPNWQPGKEEMEKLPSANKYEIGMDVGTGTWGPTPQKYVKREDYAEVERSNVILKKNVRDLQESLTTAHKRIAELAGIVTNKNVSLKAIGGIVEEELKYKKPMYDQVPLKSIKEIVSKEIVSL